MAGAPGHDVPLSNSMSQANDYSQMVINEQQQRALEEDSVSVHMQQAHDNPDMVHMAKQAAYALYRPEPPQHSKIPLDS